MKRLFSASRCSASPRFSAAVPSIRASSEYQVCNGRRLLLLPRPSLLQRVHRLALPAGQRLRRRLRVRPRHATCIAATATATTRSGAEARDCSVTGCPPAYVCKLSNGVAQCVALGGGDGASHERRCRVRRATRRRRRRRRRRAPTPPKPARSPGRATPTRTAAATARSASTGSASRRSISAPTARSAWRRAPRASTASARRACTSTHALPHRLRVRLHARRVQPQSRRLHRLGSVDLPGRRDLRRGPLRPAVHRHRRGRLVPGGPGVRQRRLHPRPGGHLRLRQRRQSRAAREHLRATDTSASTTTATPRAAPTAGSTCAAVVGQRSVCKNVTIETGTYAVCAAPRPRSAATAIRRRASTAAGGKVCVDGYCL